jgi:hypothetical protein
MFAFARFQGLAAAPPGTAATPPPLPVWQDLATLAAEVCPNAGATPNTPGWERDLAELPIADWAAKHLGFHPAPKQAEVLNSTHRNLVLCCHRKWGKTITISLKALHYALSAPDRAIGVLAPSLKQGGLVVYRVREFAAALGLKFRRYMGRDYSIQFPNGSRIYAIPHNTTTALGDEAEVLIVDEAAVVKDAVLDAVSPSTARKRSNQWFLSTPVRQTGNFYRIWHDESDAYHRVLATVADTPEMDPQYLESYRRASPARYETDFECRFAKPADKLVPRSFVEAIRRYPKGEGPPPAKEPALPVPPNLREILANMVRHP